MKLTQAQVKVIMETIYSGQEYVVPVVFGNMLRLIRNEIEKDYSTCEEDRERIVNGLKDEKGKLSSENEKIANEQYLEILNASKEYNIEPIPLSIQERVEALPLKFFLNLDPILAKQ